MSAADPIGPAIQRWCDADAAFLAAHHRARSKWPHDPVRAEEIANRAAWPARDRALRALYATDPTTLAGLAALARIVQDEECEAFASEPTGDGLRSILRGLARLAAEAEPGERTAARRTPTADAARASA